MVAAFLTQFPADTFDVRARNFVDTITKLDGVFDEIRAQPGIVLHALVDPAMKWRVAEHCLRLKLHACDLTGPFVDFLANASGTDPAPNVRKLHDVDDAYRRRVKAVEFALEHDDGLGLDTLHHADVVLVGVSRTGKTPTCMYLAQQGHKAANVSLAAGVAPPAQLLALPPSKVAALIIDPRQLAEIRTRRQRQWHMADTTYNTAAHVEAEVAQARHTFARNRWPVFDVTDQAVEETAARIVDRLGLGTPSDRGARDPSGAQL
jgi:regulator of PEP synthase PpsR (kinase-PPPase family)